VTLDTKNLVKPRMSKSTNVERDVSAEALNGYIPTGRVLDVIRRIASGMIEPSSGRAFSITGPYGSGKSSFAVFLSALLDSTSSPTFKKAFQELTKADPELGKLWKTARKSFSADESVSRAFVTAKTEPLVTTLSRGLLDSVSTSKSTKTSSASAVLEDIKKFAQKRPLVILVDEFGKNLEAFGDERASGDPYLLQEIAELSQGLAALPIVLVTMQHLAFDEYVMDAGSTQRREWAKVQGRFHDIGFLDSPDQSYLLIAASFEKKSPTDSALVRAWYKKQRDVLVSLDLGAVLEYAEPSYPLHPISMVALPDLCARFGQSERTLFSFLGGSEPGALPSLAGSKTEVPLRFVGLDAIYDYFVGAAGSFIGASHSASRWIEVETRVRDASGLNSNEQSLLKSIGVLNLLSAGGQLRASKDVLVQIWNDCIVTRQKFEPALESLVRQGLVTYREFADEYRIWSGSDFNLRAAIESERRNLADLSIDHLLSSVAALEASVAGRHSQSTGVLRVFPRFIVGPKVEQDFVDSLDATYDGMVLLAQGALPDFGTTQFVKPILIALGRPEFSIRHVAIEVEALKRVLLNLQNSSDDWVAIHEVGERLAHASAELNSLLDGYWDPQFATWYLLEPNHEVTELPRYRNLSALLSDVCDSVYCSTPRVANEMIARRELTSQGAKARRTVVDAIFAKSSYETLGIEGYGPERAIYEAVICAPGFHAMSKIDGEWKLKDPRENEWKKVWVTLSKQMTSARDRRISLTELVSPLSLPPYGLKDGVLGLLSALLVAQHASDLALYEYGSLVLSIDGAVIERMLRNPDVFSVRNTGVSSGPRFEMIQALRSRLLMAENSEATSFLQVARALYREVRALEPFAQQTDLHLSKEARAVRKAFKEAVEPDLLIFETLPLVFERPLVPVALRRGQIFDSQDFANSLVDTLLELKSTYQCLLDRCLESIGAAIALNANSEGFRERIYGQAVNVLDSIIQPKLKTFTYALTRDTLDDRAWLENIAMVVCDGIPPRMWNDEQESKFQLQIVELGANFRRLQALLYDRLATSVDGYESRRITVTWPDGREISESVALSHQEMSAMDGILGGSLKKLEEVFGSEFEARKALSAWLWVSDTQGSSELDLEEGSGEVQGA
jgi:hypothetical protein